MLPLRSIENSDVGNLVSTNVIHPSNTRLNRVVPITIQYGNGGNIDVPIPTRFLISVRGAPLAFVPDELDQEEQFLLLEFSEQDGPPGILRPGATGSITVYSFSSHPLRFYIQE